MNAKDFITILEYKNTFKKTPKKKPSLKDIDIAAVFLELESQEKKIKAAKEQIQKLLKEEKKEDKKSSVTPLVISMWLLATAPITGPLMLLYWAKTFAAIQGLH